MTVNNNSPHYSRVKHSPLLLVILLTSLRATVAARMVLEIGNRCRLPAKWEKGRSQTIELARFVDASTSPAEQATTSRLQVVRKLLGTTHYIKELLT
jgi:hypothetical protein